MQYNFKISSGSFIRMAIMSVVLMAFVTQMNAQPAKTHNATGSAVTLKSDSTTAFAATSLERIIQGHAAGVKVTAADGAPGAAVDVLVRGMNFIKGGNQPTYILDGVVLSHVQQTNRKGFWSDDADYQMLQNPLLALNPMDIESIEVLKDVASTAIYGSMGANGVIIINTKQRSKLGQKVSFASGVTLSNNGRKMEVLSKKQWLNYMINKEIPIDEAGLGADVDWQKELLTRTFGVPMSVGTQNYLSVEGLSQKDKVAYYLSLGYRTQDGIVVGSGTKNLSVTINLDNPIGKAGRVGMRTLVTRNEANMISGVNLLGNTTLISYLTGAIPCWVDTNFENPDVLLDNPHTMNDSYEDLNTEWRIIPNLYAEATLFKLVTIGTNIGADYRDSKRDRFIGTGLYKGYVNQGVIGRTDMFGTRYNWDNTISANLKSKKIGQFFLQGGFSVHGNDFYDKMGEGSYLDGTALKLKTKALHMVNNRSMGNFLPYSFMMFSGWGHIAWSLQQKYFINATFRSDKYQSHTDRWDMYPAVSAAWDVKREKFLENVSFLSALKIRGGWGVSGFKQNDPYRYFPFQNFNEREDLEIDPEKRPLHAFDSYHHADMTEYNAGLDLGFFNNRLSFSVDYFNRTTKENLDIVYMNVFADKSTYSPKEREAKSTSPWRVSAPWRSESELEISGMELSLNATIIDQTDWKWNFGGNIFYNDPVIRKAHNDEGRYIGNSIGTVLGENRSATMFVDGKAPGLFYGLRAKGFTTEANYMTAPSYLGQELLPGNIFFADRTGDHNVDDADRTEIGNPNPIFSFGFFTSLQYKSWDLRASFYGNYGNQILNLNRVMLANLGDGRNTNVMLEAYHGSYTLGGSEYAAINSLGMGEISTYTMEDGSFLRCSDITLGYRFTLGPKVTKYMKGLALNLSVKNAFAFSKYSGYDPEVNSFTSDVARYGIDCGSYPTPRIFMLKLSTTF